MRGRGAGLSSFIGHYSLQTGAGQDRTCCNASRQTTIRSAPVVPVKRPLVLPWIPPVGGPGPGRRGFGWETVWLLKALELIWIIMVYDSGEVVESLESEVIWG